MVEGDPTAAAVSVAVPVAVAVPVGEPVACSTPESSKDSSPDGSTGVSVTTSSEFSIYPASESVDTLVGINLTGCAAPSDTDRAPVDVVVVADVSGSMGGAKMTLLKETLKLLLGDLVGKDRVGLVTFDTNVKEPLSLQALTPEVKTSAQGTIDRLRAGSCTNLSGGLFQGIQQLLDDANKVEKNQTVPKNGAPTRCRTVLLMTDGMANVGIQNANQIVPIVEKMLKDTGISLHTFGYGADHDSTMLREIATAGNGSYYFVEGVDDIRGAFGDCLGGLLSVIAQNLELTLEATHGASISKVHHKGAVAAGTGRWKIKYSDLYGEEQRDLLVGIKLPPTTTDGPMDPLHCTLSYVDVLAGAPVNAHINVTVQRSLGAIAEQDQNRNERLELQSTRLRVADTLDSARAAAEKGDLKSARALVSETRQQVTEVSKRCASVEGAEAMLPTFLEDLDECGEGLSDQVTFSSRKHKMTMLAEGHMQQRCMESTVTYDGAGGGKSALRSNAYRTKAKAKKASAWGLS